MNKITENLEKKEPALDISGAELLANYDTIRQCTHLEALYLLSSGSDIFDFSFLRNLTQLRVLYVGFCHLEHNEDLAYLEHLEELHLPSNLITDITALQHLRKLKVLDLTCNYVVNLEPLRHLEQLQTLRLDRNELEEITVLENLPNLEVLDISDNRLKNVAPIQNNLALRELYVNGTASLQDFAFLKRLTNLEVLYAYMYGKKDISSLCYLHKLQQLALGENQIEDITPLENMLELEMLSIGGNNIQNIDCLQNMTKLTSLHIERNQITDIACLQNLPALKLLDASENKIQTLPALSAKDLQLLRLNNNQITHFPTDFLEGFPALETFEIHNNPIENLPKKLFHKGSSLKVLREYGKSK